MPGMGQHILVVYHFHRLLSSIHAYVSHSRLALTITARLMHFKILHEVSYFLRVSVELVGNWCGASSS